MSTETFNDISGPEVLPPHVGEVIHGRVVKQLKGCVLVHLRGQFTGKLPFKQWQVRDMPFRSDPVVGDTLLVEVKESFVGQQGGSAEPFFVLQLHAPTNPKGELPSIGETIPVRVFDFISKGALVFTESGVRGIIRKREVSWTCVKTEFLLAIGDVIDAKVMTIAPTNKYGPFSARIELSIRALIADPWPDLMTYLNSAKRSFAGTVTNVAPFGVFVTIACQLNSTAHFVSGLLHKTEMSISQKIIGPNDFCKGDAVDVIIKDINVDTRRIWFGLATPTNIVQDVARF